MAVLQSLRQQHLLERSMAPTSSRMIGGMSGSSEGVPRMHPLKSSMPALKAGSMIHGLRIKKFKTLVPPSSKISSNLKLPGLY